MSEMVHFNRQKKHIVDEMSEDEMFGDEVSGDEMSVHGNIDTLKIFQIMKLM